jgi:hypothetical protein
MGVSREPTHGWTQLGHAVHGEVWHHLPDATKIQRFNARFAVSVTKIVGSMWCAYAFAAFDLISLPDAIRGGTATIVQWIAQTFLQLVLLSIIMVGQSVQAQASDARAAKTFEDTEKILNELNLETEGGLHEVLAAVQAMHADLKPPAEPE